MSWLSNIVAEAKAKLSHPGAPTEGQLTELVHMLEALGVTVEGKLKATAPAIAAAADAPIAAVQTMIETEIAKAKTDIARDLADLFKAFEARQVAAVEDLRAQVAPVLAVVNAALHPVAAVSPAAPAPASATVQSAAPTAQPAPSQPAPAAPAPIPAS